ncbi:putative glycerol-3-phosphate 1-O-acyltransferase [Helianthus anomalus]
MDGVNKPDENGKISNLLYPDAKKQTFGRKSQNWQNLKDENGIFLYIRSTLLPVLPSQRPGLYLVLILLKSLYMLCRTKWRGSKLIWIAASGGRDRPDPITYQWSPAPFDASAVDNMRRLVVHAGVPGHIYPLSLLCYDIMPPTPQVSSQNRFQVVADPASFFTGFLFPNHTRFTLKKRSFPNHTRITLQKTFFFQIDWVPGNPVNPSKSAPDFNKITASCGGPDKAKEAYSRALYDSVCRQYNVLKTAIHGAQGSDASTTSVSLTQPWQLLN